MIPFNAIPDANVIPANDGLAIADPRSLRVTLRKGNCVIWNFRDFKGYPIRSGKVRNSMSEGFRRHLNIWGLTFGLSRTILKKI